MHGEALRRIRKWVRIIGVDYHPDMKRWEYDPPLSTKQKADYEKDHAWLFDNVRDIIYTMVMAIMDGSTSLSQSNDPSTNDGSTKENPEGRRG